MKIEGLLFFWIMLRPRTNKFIKHRFSIFAQKYHHILQPPDSEIIKAFKYHYRSCLLDCFIFKKNDMKTVDKAIEGINILDVVLRVESALRIQKKDNNQLL